MVEGLGGTIHSAWLTFGEYDTVSSWVAGQRRGGALTDVKTTPLLRWEEGL